MGVEGEQEELRTQEGRGEHNSQMAFP